MKKQEEYGEQSKMNTEREELKIIGKQLASLRKHRNLSQKELGKKCGVSRVYIGQIERGEINPTLGVIFKICDSLNIVADIRFTPIEGGE